jgi:hypothetical protein
VTVNNYTYSVIVKPKLADYIPEIKYQQVTIQLTSNNTMKYEIHDVENKLYSEEELEVMRKPLASPIGEETAGLILWDILDIEYDPKNTFCY